MREFPAIRVNFDKKAVPEGVHPENLAFLGDYLSDRSVLALIQFRGSKEGCIDSAARRQVASYLGVSEQAVEPLNISCELGS